MNLKVGTEGGQAVALSARGLPPSTVHPPPFPARHRGFTLVEMLVVISIMVILATLAVAAAFKVRETNRIKVARTSGIRLAQAIEAYRDLQGYLPVQVTNPPLVPSTVVYDGETDADGAYGNWDVIRQVNGVMSRDRLLEVTARELDGVGSFKDPWGQPFRVVMWKEKPADALDRYFQVYSCGPNGRWEHGQSDPAAAGRPDDIVPRH